MPSSSVILPISLSFSIVVTFAIGLLIGCLTCLCYVRARVNRAPQRVCLNCTSHSGINGHENDKGSVCGGDYETIPLPPMSQARMDKIGMEAKMDVAENEAYGKLPAPIVW